MTRPISPLTKMYVLRPAAEGSFFVTENVIDAISLLYAMRLISPDAAKQMLNAVHPDLKFVIYEDCLEE